MSYPLQGRRPVPFPQTYRWLAALLVITVCLWAWPLGEARAFGAEAKVVYHVDFADPGRVSAMITNISNMATHYDSQLRDYDIRIVFLSHGVRFVTDEDLEGTPFAADAELKERRENLRGRLMGLVNGHGVKLELCDLTRQAINLDADKLYDSVELVSSGVVRIVELQDEGFRYLKVE
ncbi:DsrE family protein [Thioalkalivibrio sulfidiphilus]|uniref:DsrE family protein n=1 Tax=Thioalkalivibrio sulfidiphilus TaxID=1033854 RepID=UPI003B2A44B1